VTIDPDDRDLWVDSFGDTWERLETRFVHVARADESDNPNLTVGRMTWPAEDMERDFGPLTRIEEQP
jgi:hypothetical protein